MNITVGLLSSWAPRALGQIRRYRVADIVLPHEQYLPCFSSWVTSWFLSHPLWCALHCTKFSHWRTWFHLPCWMPKWICLSHTVPTHYNECPRLCNIFITVLVYETVIAMLTSSPWKRNRLQADLEWERPCLKLWCMRWESGYKGPPVEVAVKRNRETPSLQEHHGVRNDTRVTIAVQRKIEAKCMLRSRGALIVCVPFLDLPLHICVWLLSSSEMTCVRSDHVARDL